MNNLVHLAKKKISLLSTSPCRVNVDIHFALVTKKFFSPTTSTFNADAFARQKSGRLDSVDNWLFLAQHGCFHLFSDSKWIRDLDIVYQSFTDDERRRMESWLGDHMIFVRTPEGKNVLISIDSRVSQHNPFYKALKAVDNTLLRRQSFCFRIILAEKTHHAIILRMK